MLPTPEISVWSSSARLTLGVPPAQPRRRTPRRRSTGPSGRGRCARSSAGHGSPRPVGGRTSRSSTRPPNVRWSTKRSSRPPSAKPIRTCRCFSSGASGGLDEQLPAHPEVRRRAHSPGPVERQPQVLAAPRAPRRCGRRPGGRRDRRRRRGGGGRRGGAAPRPRRRCGRRPSAAARRGRSRPRAARARRFSGRSSGAACPRRRSPARPPRRRACSASFLLRPVHGGEQLAGDLRLRGEHLRVVRARRRT